MRNISEMEIIQIDVTNVCDKSCSNCTRLCGHHRGEKTYFMDVDYYEKCVVSLKEFPGIVGMIGGEPTLHPRFPELCEIVSYHIKEKERRGLWSNRGAKFRAHKEIIDRTFGHFNLNDHVSHDIFHTPILVASEDMIKSGVLTEERWRCYTDACWVQNTWSATVTPKGAWFCEVAAVLDHLFEGGAGWDIEKEPNWWRKPVAEYGEQVAWACRKCGGQLPLRPRRSSEGIDDVSASSLERLIAARSPKIAAGKYEIFAEGLDPAQVRNVAWYVRHRNGIMDRLKRFCRRQLASK
jgi:hypothetical protein